MALVEPFILMNNHGNQPKGLDEPVATVTTGNRHYLVEPFILQQQSGGAPRSVEDPLPTIATDGAQAVVEPFLVPFYGERQGQNPRTHSVDEPLPVVPASGDGKFGLVEPHLTKYYGTGRPSSVNEPVPTVTTKDRLGLVMPVIHGRALDIRFRMLQPHELAAAMSFARDYIFVGTREAKVKQIGNAVPERTAYALSLAILEPYAAKRRVVWRDEVPA
jgi:DNA (cytosine-5)-methyltransferase 1